MMLLWMFRFVQQFDIVPENIENHVKYFLKIDHTVTLAVTLRDLQLFDTESLGISLSQSLSNVPFAEPVK